METGEFKPSNKIYFAAAVAVIAVIAAVMLIPGTKPTGNAVSNNIATTTTIDTSKNLCGNGICDSGENCNTCAKDCNCVQLKLSKSVTYDQFLIWCSAKIQYAAVNSGSIDAKGVRLELKTEAPHLNEIRDRKEISLGSFPANMTPVMGEEKLSYECGDDIVRVSMRLYDADGHEFFLEEEKRS